MDLAPLPSSGMPGDFAADRQARLETILATDRNLSAGEIVFMRHFIDQRNVQRQ